MATRTIIKTDTAGWFEDPTTGKKTRKQDGDRVMTRAEYEQHVLDQDPAQAQPEQQEQPEAKADTNGGKAATPPAEEVELTTGKTATGKTLVIQCAWVDPDKRTPEQVKLFEGDPSKITYEAVKQAAGGKRSAFPDGTKRTIKPQDAFQVRFSPANQQKWRAELRRRKTKARREAARKAAAKA